MTFGPSRPPPGHDWQLLDPPVPRRADLPRTVCIQLTNNKYTAPPNHNSTKLSNIEGFGVSVDKPVNEPIPEVIEDD